MVGSFVIKCLCMENELVLLFYYLQQKAIFSKSWGGPEKDLFFGFFGFLFFWFFSSLLVSRWWWGVSSFFFLLLLFFLLLSLFFLLFSSFFFPLNGRSSSNPAIHRFRQAVTSSSFSSPSASPSASYPSPEYHRVSFPGTHHRYPSLVLPQGVLPTRVPGPAQRAARIVFRTHVPPDTLTAPGGIATFDASDGMVHVIFIT